MTFEGFSSAGLEFLTQLGSRDRDWFQEHRATYDSDVVPAAKAFVEAIADELHGRVSAEIIGQPKANGSISPINNDIRFAENAPPYKDHLLFRWWEGSSKKIAPTLFVRLSEHNVGFATGVNFASVDAWREAVAGPAGAALSVAIGELSHGKDLDVAGAALKRVPAPYDADHPRAELLKHKGFQVRWPEPAPLSIGTAEFVDWCAGRLEECAPVHRWLVNHLG